MNSRSIRSTSQLKKLDFEEKFTIEKIRATNLVLRQVQLMANSKVSEKSLVVSFRNPTILEQEFKFSDV